MLGRTVIDRMLAILRKDCRRALRMKLKGFPKAYYCAFVVRDVEWFNTWASSGSVYRRRADRKRNVYCDLRVGSYEYDQVTNGGINDNDPDTESAAYVRVPIDDRHLDGLRIGLWRLMEARFKEALAEYSHKEAQRITTVNPNSGMKSFARLKKTHHVRYESPESIDEEKWVRFCKEASKWMAELPRVSIGWVEFDASQETKLFVNSENRVIVQHSRIYSLIATLMKLTREGASIQQELVINCSRASELPDMRKFKKLVMDKYQKLVKLTRAKQIHAFSGPVLLYPGPSGLLFHEAIGHRLEGSRLLASGEGQTFKGQIGKKVLEIDLTIRDNPKLRTFKGQRCVGAYDFDDEGSPARNALLVESGVLKDFLSTRSQHVKRKFVPNGHARNAKFQRPISRMGVTIVEAKSQHSIADLKKMLIEELKKQKKPFGMIVYETSGGETETMSYDFQAFAGEISFATLIYPDGKEIVVRGVDFVGTPLQALGNIIAVSKEQELDNSYCGAESGMIPVSTIAPAALLSSLELQTKDEELITQAVLPKPKL